MNYKEVHCVSSSEPNAKLSTFPNDQTADYQNLNVFHDAACYYEVLQGKERIS